MEDAQEPGGTSMERWHLYQVAVRARDLMESLTGFQVYPTSGKWQAYGRDETLTKLYEAIQRWDKWEQENKPAPVAG